MASRRLVVEELLDAALAEYQMPDDEYADPSWAEWNAMSLNERALEREINQAQQELWDERLPENAAIDRRLIELGWWDGEGDRPPLRSEWIDDPEYHRLVAERDRKVAEIGERLVARQTLRDGVRGMRTDVAADPTVYRFMRRRHRAALRASFTPSRAVRPAVVGRVVSTRPPASARTRRPVRRRRRGSARSPDPDLPEPLAAGQNVPSQPPQTHPGHVAGASPAPSRTMRGGGGGA